MDPQRHGPALVALLGLALFFGVRLSVYDVDIPNPDIAGIFYNADVLLDGGLPYRDTAEIKPPGAFFLVAAIFGAVGRDLGALQWMHTGWLLLGAPAIWIAAAAGRPDEQRSMAAAIATAVYLFYVGMFTYNYSSWMVVPYAWAFAALMRSLETGSARWALLGGAAAAAAVLTIQRAAVLGLLAAALFVLARRHSAVGATRRVALLWFGGALLPLAVIALPYLVAGALPSLAEGILPWAVATDYADAPDGSQWATVSGAVAQLFTTFTVAAVLIALAALSRVLDRRAAAPELPPAMPAVLFVLVSVLGAALGGGRFYIHYLVQYVPALALLASFAPRRPAVAVLAGLCLVGAVVEVASGDAHRYEARARRLAGGSTAGRAAGEHIATRTGPQDTIFAWGWTAWRVYYWADRRAPGRVYKPLGTLTTFNRNTAFEDGGDIVLRTGAATDAFIESFDRAPPAYVVLSPSYTAAFGAAVDPLANFDALRERLQQDYRPDARYGDLTLLRRR